GRQPDAAAHPPHPGAPAAARSALARALRAGLAALRTCWSTRCRDRSPQRDRGASYPHRRAGGPAQRRERRVPHPGGARYRGRGAGPVRGGGGGGEAPADAALGEFVRYQRFDPRQPKAWQEERYVAYLLTQQGPPRWIALGEAKPIDAAIDAVLAAMDSRIGA